MRKKQKVMSGGEDEGQETFKRSSVPTFLPEYSAQRSILAHQGPKEGCAKLNAKGLLIWHMALHYGLALHKTQGLFIWWILDFACLAISVFQYRYTFEHNAVYCKTFLRNFEDLKARTDVEQTFRNVALAEVLDWAIKAVYNM